MTACGHVAIRSAAMLVIVLGLATQVFAQGQAAARPGPVVEQFGAVFDVPDPDVETPTDRTWRVVFDVAQAASKADEVNPRIDTLARFLNMHARAGVAREQMRLALVLHGSAGTDALDHAGYRARFGSDNPTRDLIAALQRAGVEVYLCGQTAAARDLPRAALAPGVKLALSAMTMLVMLQAEGYQLVAF